MRQRRRPSSPRRASSGHGFSVSVAPDLAQSDGLRRELRAWCSSRGIPGDLTEDLALVTSELFTNAAKATVGGSLLAVDIRQLPTGGVRVAVANRGEAFHHRRSCTPSWDTIGGRGLAIAESLGALTVRSSGGTTVVEVVLGGSSDAQPSVRT